MPDCTPTRTLDFDDCGCRDLRWSLRRVLARDVSELWAEGCANVLDEEDDELIILSHNDGR